MIINLGDAPFKAFIKVTYPNGTCTVSLGNKSFTHSGGGTHTFTVNKKGTWTVRATNNRGVSEIANVSITYRGQVSSVTLTCWDGYVYNAGDIYEEFTGGYSTVPANSNAPAASFGTDGTLHVGAAVGNANPCAFISNKAIDITKFSKLVAYGKHSSSSDSVRSTVGVANSRNVGWGLSIASGLGNKSWATVTVDISSLSGAYYIGIWAAAYASYAEVTYIRLE